MRKQIYQINIKNSYNETSKTLDSDEVWEGLPHLHNFIKSNSISIKTSVNYFLKKNSIFKKSFSCFSDSPSISSRFQNNFFLKFWPRKFDMFSDSYESYYNSSVAIANPELQAFFNSFFDDIDFDEEFEFDYSFILDIVSSLWDRFTKKINWVVKHKSKWGWKWSLFSKSKYKYFKPNLKFFFFRKVYFFKKNSRFKRIKNIIRFKKKTSFLKKKGKLELFFLKRMHMFKFKKNIFLKKFYRRRKRRLFSKYIDLYKRTNLIWYYNRDYFKKYLRIPKIRQKAKTRFFSNFLKTDPLTFLKFWDDSILNLMLMTRLVPSLKEAFFLATSGLVFINGFQVNKFDAHINYGDVIQFGLFDSFFKFYRWNIHFKQRFFKRAGYHLWMLNRFRFNFYKQSTTRIPEYFNRVMFFHEDVPRFLEIDYSTMTFIVILRKTKIKFFSFFFKKTPALNMLRLYNWKYIT